MDKKEQIKEQIIDIISTILDKKVSENCNRENEELWDSMAHLQIIVTIEEEFNIKIPVETIPHMNSVEDILEEIEKNG